MEVHLKDFVFMRRLEEEPIKVPATAEALTQKMAAGYQQCDPPAERATEKGKN